MQIAVDGFILALVCVFFMGLMMRDPDNIKIMAKSKVKLSTALLLMLVLMGMATEYAHMNRSLAQAVVVLLPQQERIVIQEVLPRAENVVSPIVETQRKGKSAEAFMRYLQEVNDMVVAVRKPESALGQIILPKMKAVKEPEVRFNEQVIEVYDEAGEPMEVVEVRSETETVPVAEATEELEAELVPVAEGTSVAIEEDDTRLESVNDVRDEEKSDALIEPITESAGNMEDVAEVAVNTEENVSEFGEDGEEMPEIDMMKEIIAREQGTVSEN